VVMEAVAEVVEEEVAEEAVAESGFERRSNPLDFYRCEPMAQVFVKES
jgi:hypothetical protein